MTCQRFLSNQLFITGSIFPPVISTFATQSDGGCQGSPGNRACAEICLLMPHFGDKFFLKDPSYLCWFCVLCQNGGQLLWLNEWCKRPLGTKVQLISKELFCFFNSSKKRTKNFCLNRSGQKLKFSSSFFGRIQAPKRHFEIISRG